MSFTERQKKAAHALSTVLRRGGKIVTTEIYPAEEIGEDASSLAVDGFDEDGDRIAIFLISPAGKVRRCQ